MKFLCPQCKAKYRIADEKLEQRSSSKMKCRKCGHIIDIKTAATPESIRATPDDEEVEDAGMTGGTGGTRPVPRVAPKGGSTTSLRAATPPPRRAATPPKRTGAAPPRRSGVVAVARAVAEKEPAEAEPEAPVAPPPPVKNEFEEDAPTRIHDGGELSAAFSFAVGQGAEAAPAVPDEWYVGIDGSPVGPLTPAQLKDKAVARKATLDSLVWKDGFEEWKPLRDFPELVALVADAAAAHAYQPEARTVPAPSPLEAEEGRPKVVSEPLPDVYEEMGLKSRKQAVSHPVAWAAVFVAMAFGVTIGIVLFSKTEKQEIVKYVQVQSSAKPVEHNDAPADSAQTMDELTLPGGGPRRSGSGQPKPEPSAPKSGGGSNLLNGLDGLHGVGPAAGGGNDTASGNAPGGQLDSTSIGRTVANYSPGVRRGCWETALSARSPDAPASARVGVTITIASSGNVDSVTTTGDPKGYPNLARCIESKVRTWRFQRSSGTTTAQVPFVFAAQ